MSKQNIRRIFKQIIGFFIINNFVLMEVYCLTKFRDAFNKLRMKNSTRCRGRDCKDFFNFDDLDDLKSGTLLNAGRNLYLFLNYTL